MTTNSAGREPTCGLIWISSNLRTETNPIGSFYAIRTDYVFQNIGTIVKAYPASNHKNLEFPAARDRASIRRAFDAFNFLSLAFEVSFHQENCAYCPRQRDVGATIDARDWRLLPALKYRIEIT